MLSGYLNWIVEVLNLEDIYLSGEALIGSFLELIVSPINLYRGYIQTFRKFRFPHPDCYWDCDCLLDFAFVSVILKNNMLFYP